ncbi:hypothetical protein GGR58DRAFT_508001 [Xylaria digitata]|nr:hypothetical protein GGR58DRAFT_508001 [Xylaria digitata]
MRVLTYQTILASLLILVRSEARGDNHHGACKTFPGTPAWPLEKTWAKFNQSTGGKLIKPGPPPGAVCHPGQPTFDADQCAIVTAAWTTYDFHVNHPVSNMWQQYNNDTCLVDPDYPCSGEGYPAYVVNATTAKDVKLTLEFARKHNIRVVVKSSGHDYQGRSQAPGALSIWIHHMQSYKTHDTFKPAGCNFTINTPAVTAAGGTQVGTIYEALDKINQTIVGGTSKTVSVGGYLTGGGHSILGPRYGMGADNVLEVEVVTPMVDASPYPSFNSWFQVKYDKDPTGFDQYVGSRLLDEKALTTPDSATLGQAFKLARGSAYLVAGKGVHNAKPRGGSTSVSPTWRKAVVHAVNGHDFAPLNATARAEALKIVDDRTKSYRELAPDMGAYVNENNPGEPDWQHTFWGENYERLVQIKREVDPEDILWCHPCVGNDRWEQIGYRLCRVGENHTGQTSQ